MSSPSSPPPTIARRELAGLVRVDGREADVAAFEAAMVGFFVEAADLMGVPKSVAALYGICFAAPEPLSFADIEQRLDLSKGSISHSWMPSNGSSAPRSGARMPQPCRPGRRRCTWR